MRRRRLNFLLLIYCPHIYGKGILAIKKVSYQVALGGIIAALCVVLMFLTGVFPFATYALPALAGMLLILPVIELGAKWAWLTYAAVALLSLLITPDREAALFFILFFGYYPIIKAKLETIKLRLLEWVVKLIIYNVGVVGAFLLAINIFGMNQVMDELGKYGIPLFMVVANITFVVYDIALTRLISQYLAQIRPRLFKRMK